MFAIDYLTNLTFAVELPSYDIEPSAKFNNYNNFQKTAAHKKGVEYILQNASHPKVLCG
jgi:hypothetical protein